MVGAELHADLDFSGGQLTGKLSIAPARVGPNVLDVTLGGKDGTATSVRSVRLFFSNPELDMARLEIAGVLDPIGWHAQNAILPAAGIWTVSVEVRISDFEQVRAKTTVTIGE